jgi:hypothetical protein
MASTLQCRVISNRPGLGWYWEVVETHTVIARGLAYTRSEAVAQAAAVVQRAEVELQVTPVRQGLIGPPERW